MSAEVIDAEVTVGGTLRGRLGRPHPVHSPVRDLRLDALRGLAILTVVAGHATTSGTLGQIIFSFHMPLLMFASGLAAAMGRVWSDSPGRWARRRVWALGLPYVAWFVVAELITNTQRGVIKLAGIWRGLTVGLITALINPRLGPTLWFLYVLLECGLILAVIFSVTRSRASRLAGVALVGTLCFLAPHSGGIEPYHGFELGASLSSGVAAMQGAGPGLLAWRSVLWLFPFFATGFCVQGLALGQPTRAKAGVIVVISLAIWGAIIIALWPPLGAEVAAASAAPLRLHMSAYVYVLWRYAAAFSAISAFYFVMFLLGRTLLRPAAWIGGLTLGIYATHGYFLGWTAGSGLARWLIAFAVATVLAVLSSLLLEANPASKVALLGGVWRRTSRTKLGSPAIACVFGLALFGYVYSFGGPIAGLAISAALVSLVALQTIWSWPFRPSRNPA